MPRSTSIAFLTPLACTAVLCGCAATQQARYDAYDKSLAHWQGASEQSLRGLWGTPRSEDSVEGGKVLLYVTQPTSNGDDHPSFTIGLGSFGGWGGSHTSVGAGVGLTAPVGSATPSSGSDCVTRFLVHEGKVQSWTFEGGGCGAPVL